VLRGKHGDNTALSVTRGLVIDQPWVDLIADGKKTWEMRTRPTNVRGWIGLIGKGTGTIIGIACLAASLPPLEPDAHHLHFKKHRVPRSADRKRYTGRYVIPWRLTKAFRLSTPVPYEHPTGAVTWVTLSNKVSRSLTHRLRARYPEERT
jgi:hypothetical protein